MAAEPAEQLPGAVRHQDRAGAVEFAINAIYPHRHNLSAKLRSFIDLLGERFLEHRKWMDPSLTEREGGDGAAASG